MHIKERLEDFYVEEVLDLHLEDKGKYSYFTLEKRNWTTLKALDAIAQTLHVTVKRFAVAGQKDRKGITKQYVSVYGVSEDKIRQVRIKDIHLVFLGYGKKVLSLGQLRGNRFRIVARALQKPLREIHSIPNYFDEQRFGGYRPNLHIIGKKILFGEYEEAVREYGSEQRASNVLRRRVLPYQVFIDDIVKGGKHSSFSAFDTNAWLAVAFYNNKNSEEVRGNILARLNDPKRHAQDVDRIKRLYKGAATLPNVGTINQKASEYVDIIFSEGKPYEIADILMYLYSREQIHHDNATSLSALWATLVGASGGVGSARIILGSVDKPYETGDSQFMFTLSQSTQAKLKDVFVYEIKDLTRLMHGIDIKDPKYLSLDGLFGVPYSNIDALRQNGAKYLVVATPSFDGVKIPITK